MQKSTILEKSRNNAAAHDEYVLVASKDALRFGLYAGVVLCFVLETIVFVHQGNFWGYHSILFVVASVASFVYYTRLKKTNYLVLGICAAVITIFSVYGFFTFG